MKAVSWKTTLSGSITAFGVILLQIENPLWLKNTAIFIAALGTLLTGLFARDNDKTSKELGLEKQNITNEKKEEIKTEIKEEIKEEIKSNPDILEVD